MQEIQITVNNEAFDIKALDTSPGNTRFEVYKNGELQFTIEHHVSSEGSDVWGLVDTGKGQAAGVSQDFINSIGRQIHSS